MTKTRREFKREAVALLESSGRPQMQIAAELGIQPSMLRQWRTTLMSGSPPPRAAGLLGAAPASPVASPSDQAAEIARLRRELDRTRMERDVLKNDRGSGPPLGGETARRQIAHGRERPFAFGWRRTPLKNMVHGLLRAREW